MWGRAALCPPREEGVRGRKHAEGQRSRRHETSDHHSSERPLDFGANPALQLALQQNATLRAKGFELQSVKAREITAGLRPNPSMNFIVEQIHLAGTPPR